MFLSTGEDHRSKLSYSINSEVEISIGTRYSDLRGRLTLLETNLGADGSAGFACDDTRVSVSINKTRWNNFSIVRRLIIMYHELGHDILDLQHTDMEGNLMQGTPHNSFISLLTMEDFIVMKNNMFNRINQTEFNCN